MSSEDVLEHMAEQQIRQRLSDENIEAGARDLARGLKLLGEDGSARVLAAVLKEIRNAAEAAGRLGWELAAPPVVPEGWEVYKDDDGLWFAHGPVEAIGTEPDRARAIRAVAWAIENDKRPPHAGDPKPEAAP